MLIPSSLPLSPSLPVQLKNHANHHPENLARPMDTILFDSTSAIVRHSSVFHSNMITDTIAPQRAGMSMAPYPRGYHHSSMSTPSTSRSSQNVLISVHCNRSSGSTLQCLLQREEYKSWKEGASESRLLWLKGTRECWVLERWINCLNVVSEASAGKPLLFFFFLFF